MKRILGCSIALLAGAAFAQQGALSTLKFDPPNPVAGQEVKITVGTEGQPPTFCGMVVRFGDGNETSIKISSSHQQLPLTLGKVYGKAGTYQVRAEGKKVTSHLPCLGSVEQPLIVAAAPSSASGKAVAGGSLCPEGYKLKGKTGKAGDFTCTAGKGAQKPEKMLDCAEGLEYFQSKSSLGCRKEKK